MSFTTIYCILIILAGAGAYTIYMWKQINTMEKFVKWLKEIVDEKVGRL